MQCEILKIMVAGIQIILRMTSSYIFIFYIILLYGYSSQRYVNNITVVSERKLIPKKKPKFYIHILK